MPDEIDLQDPLTDDYVDPNDNAGGIDLSGDYEYSLSSELVTEAAIRKTNASRETRSGNWQMDAINPGVYVEGINAVEQSMWIILNSERGSQPMMPDFGSGIWLLLDGDLPIAAPLIAAEIKRDLNKWEPRITVTKVTYTLQNSFGTTTGVLSGVRFNIFWYLNADNSNEQVSDAFAVTSSTGTQDSGIYFILATETGEFILTDGSLTIPIL